MLKLIFESGIDFILLPAFKPTTKEIVATRGSFYNVAELISTLYCDKL